MVATFSILKSPMPDHNYFCEPDLADRRSAARPLPPAAVRARHAADDGACAGSTACSRRPKPRSWPSTNGAREQGRGRRARHEAQQGRRPALPQPLAARLREAQGRPRQHREAPRQLHQGLLGQRAPTSSSSSSSRTRSRGCARRTSSTSSSRSSAMWICTRTRCRTSRWGSSSRTSSAASTNWPTRPRATTSRRARSSG